jgi:hypothetical protein
MHVVFYRKHIGGGEVNFQMCRRHVLVPETVAKIHRYVMSCDKLYNLILI